MLICPECGAGNTLPRGDEIDLSAYYPSEYGAYAMPSGPIAGRISRAIQAWQGWLALRTAPVGAIRGRPTGRVVDIGCGRGDLATALIRRGWQATGVEFSRDAREVAARRGIDARGPTVADAGLEPSAYDAAILRHSLEHLPDPLADLRPVVAALRSGGLVLVSVPNFDCWQRHRFEDRWYHLDLPRHRHHFGRRALERLLTDAGLEVIDVSTSTSGVGLPGSLQYVLLGRFVLSGGLGLRITNGLFALLQPAAMVADHLGGGGDLLHAVARKP